MCPRRVRRRLSCQSHTSSMLANNGRFVRCVCHPCLLRHWKRCIREEGPLLVRWHRRVFWSRQRIMRHEWVTLHWQLHSMAIMTLLMQTWYRKTEVACLSKVRSCMEARLMERAVFWASKRPQILCLWSLSRTTVSRDKTRLGGTLPKRSSTKAK